MKIYNLGSLNLDFVYSVDHTVTAGETLSSDSRKVFCGGKGLNQSIALARAGVRVIHGAAVGEDGQMLLDKLRSANVDVSRITRKEGSSGHAIIQVDKNGQNSILLFPGTNRLIDKEYVSEFLADAEKGDILLLQNETSGLDAAFKLATEKGMKIAFNPSPIADNIFTLPAETVNWWFCNEIEGEALFGSDAPQIICDNFIKRYPESTLVLTLGDKGCILKNRDKQFHCPSKKVKAVDTTAAGDTFTGYFLAALLQGKSEEEAVELATRASAVTVSRNGASDSIPELSEL